MMIKNLGCKEKGGLKLDQIHNTLKVIMCLGSFYKLHIRWEQYCLKLLLVWQIWLQIFCVADPRYDKSLQQLQNFLFGLVAEDKLEQRDGMYLLKK